MKILALESSAAACSAALWEDGKLLAQFIQNTGLTHSRTLLPMVHQMLDCSDQKLEQVDVVAVAAGPGSFTGLRIGVSTAKGLAWGLDKPCAACSTLESMAWPLAHMEGHMILCAMDARRGQIYHARFLALGDGLRRLCPDQAISLEELAGELEGEEKPKIIVGDGAALCYNDLSARGISAVLAPPHLRYQSAWGVACAAQELACRGALVDSAELTPVYLRLSQAERERLAREQSQKTDKGAHEHV